MTRSYYAGESEEGLDFMVTSLSLKMDSSCKDIALMYGNSVDRLLDLVNDCEELIASNYRRLTGVHSSYMLTFRKIDYNRRTVGGFVPSVKQIMSVAWADPQRGDFKLVISVHAELRPRVSKAEGDGARQGERILRTVPRGLEAAGKDVRMYTQ